MISFSSDNGFDIENSTSKKLWIKKVVALENYTLGEINFVFCDDSFLLKLNQDYLNHDTYTDIISFDYSDGSVVAGEIYISTERVTENAQDRGIQFQEELDRVLIHGILHFCGYPDKTDPEKEVMRDKEDSYLAVR